MHQVGTTEMLMMSREEKASMRLAQILSSLIGFFDLLWAL